MTEIKNMAYWKAKNTLPGINPNSEGNTDTPDGKSGSSPLQDTKAVKASDVSIEEQIAAADKRFGSGLSVNPKETYNPTGGDIRKTGIDADASKAFYGFSRSGAYKGSPTYGGLSYKEKHKYRKIAHDARVKREARKKALGK